jgi:drug/metabolite transporter (DMT)-like permease
MTAHDMAESRLLAYMRKGLVLAVLSGMIFSMDGLLITRSGAYAPYNDASLLLLVTMVCAGVHDLCAALCLTCYNWRTGRLRELGRSAASRPGRAVLGGSAIGAALGCGGYMAGLQMAGAAYTLPITTMYPAVAALLAFFVLRERIPPRGWVGLCLCVGGAALVGYVPPTGQTGSFFYLGLAFAGLAALGWGTQGVCVTSGMDFVEPEIALNIYYILSVCFYMGIAAPTAAYLSDVNIVAFAGEILTSHGTMFLAIAGCLGMTSYLAWYKAMNMIGVSRAMALNIGYALWGIAFTALLGNVEITKSLVIGALTIFLGMCLVIGNPREMLSLRKDVRS